MRIISGKFKGRSIRAPKNSNVRPTTDMAKEALFNILANTFSFDEITALDLFSGTGNISYELASRGCTNITSVEKDYGSAKFISKTNHELQLNLKVIQADAFTFLKKTKLKYDLIFADPPFQIENIETIPALVKGNELLNQGGILIVEHAKEKISILTGQSDIRKYGKVNFSIFNADT